MAFGEALKRRVDELRKRGGDIPATLREAQRNAAMAACEMGEPDEFRR
jgi:hypothetical protein